MSTKLGATIARAKAIRHGYMLQSKNADRKAAETEKDEPWIHAAYKGEAIDARMTVAALDCYIRTLETV